MLPRAVVGVMSGLACDICTILQSSLILMRVEQLVAFWVITQRT